MGFEADEAAKALRDTSGSLTKAIVTLTAPKVPDPSTDPPRSRIVDWLRSIIDQLTPHISEISVSN